MSYVLYNQTYKCRLCGETLKAASTISLDEARRSAWTLCSRYPDVHPLDPTLYSTHVCKDGSIGFMDFVGYVKEDIDEA